MLSMTEPKVIQSIIIIISSSIYISSWSSIDPAACYSISQSVSQLYPSPATLSRQLLQV